MPAQFSTLKEKKPTLRPAGVLLVFVDGVATRVSVPLTSTPRELGREAFEQLGVVDGHASRRHAQISVENGVLRVVDLGSTNGTFVDGRRLDGPLEVPLANGPVVRVGHSLLLGCSALEERSAMSKLETQLEVLRQVSSSVCLTGEPGTGRATLARHFLGASAREVWCGAPPEQLAEQLVVEGTPLLLEDVDVLPRELQRTLASSLGVKKRPLVACTARQELVGDRFEPALLEALARPSLHVPPLRERRDEIPALVLKRVSALGLTASAALVEACMLRAWPGNVRTLESELAAVAARAKAERLEVVEAELLPPESAVGSAETWTDAHLQLAADHLGIARKTAVKVLPPARLAALVQHPDATALLRAAAAEALLQLLERHDFQQAAVAQALEVSRTTLLKLMEHFELPRAAALTDAQVLDALAAHGQDVRAAAKALHVSVEALRQRLAQPRR